MLGEGPLWHVADRALYWLDYMRGEIYRFEPDSGAHEVVYSGPRVSGFTLQADGGLLLLIEGARVAIWREGSVEILIDGFPGSEGMHFNDATTDPRGRVFTGTVADDPDRYEDRVGTLYRIDVDTRITPIIEGIGISNGIGFSPSCDRIYTTDTLSRRIHAFDYDVHTGELANPRVFVETPPHEGGPDGLTVDCEGYVWSARWEGSAIYRYAPDGREDLRIFFPAKKITSLTFGGPGLRDLYVTSGGGDDRKAEGTLAGALFRIDANIEGRPPYLSRIGL
jgi:D-xylonolactonase